MDNALLPCPFCCGDGKAHVRENHSGDAFAGVECTKCGAEIMFAVHWDGDDGGERLAEAVAAWNTRATPAREAAEDLVDALEAILSIPNSEAAQGIMKVMARTGCL